MQTNFAVGDKAYYPMHGICQVADIEQRDVAGQKITVYNLHVVESGVRIIVPTEKAGSVGLRQVASTKQVKEIFAILRSEDWTIDHQTWNRRQREYMDKIRTGSAHEIAEVVRDLSRLRATKELSFGERRLLEQARNLLVKEIAVAKKSGEPQVADEIESIFHVHAA